MLGTAYIRQKVLSITYSKTSTEKPSTGQVNGLNLTLGEENLMLYHELNNKILMIIVKIAIMIIIMVMI